MNKLLTLLFCLLTIHSLGQTTEEVNKQSKKLLNKNDFVHAVPLVKKAAEAGNAEAQYNYGVCYEQGYQVAKDDKIANEWFLKSAKKGWVNAQYKLANNYGRGTGFTKNDTQAFYWSMKCAKQKDPECMFNVISCYMKGIGTNQNIDSGLVWAIRLGSSHNVDNVQHSAAITTTRYRLALMYHDGDKIKKDFKKSYMWFLIYNESKRDFLSTEQKKNITIIKEIEEQLTKSDIDKIRHDAEIQIGRKLKKLDMLYTVDVK